MSEKYIRLFSTEKNLYTPTSPVVICAGALLKDNETNRVIAQIKFKNILPKEIASILVELTLFDSADRVIGEKVKYTYLDLQLKRDEETGHKEPVFIRETNTRAFNVAVKEIVFSDKTVWTSNAEWKSLGETKTLIEYFNDSELAEQYSIDCGEQAVIIPQKIDDIWICTCGKMNFIHEKECHDCLLGYEEMAANLDVEKLRSNLIQRKYHEGIELMEQGMDMNSCNYLNKAISYFEKTDNFEDSALKITECNSKIAEIKAEKEAKKIKCIKHIKKSVKIITPIIILFIIFAVILDTVIIPSLNYNKALKLVSEQKYNDALVVFESLDNFKDSKERVKNIYYTQAVDLESNKQYEDALVLFNKLGDYKNSKNKMLDIATELSNKKDVKDAIKAFGILSKYRQLLPYVIKCSNNISKNFSVSAGDIHTIGLKKDGTVVAAGDNKYGQCNVSEWKDIMAISAGGVHTIGLKKDGTVVATGDNEYGQCNVSEWRDIVAISAGYGWTLGLRLNGTVVATGNNNYGKCNVSEWKDIVAISAGGNHSVGLKKDGTVLAVGNNADGQTRVQYVHDAISIAAGAFDTVVLSSRNDSTVIDVIGGNFSYFFNEIPVSEWVGVKAVSALYHIVGLKKDGTVVAIDKYAEERSNVSGWSDIVAISASDNYTVGLKKDGTVVATGDNGYGQCDISEWRDIALP